MKMVKSLLLGSAAGLVAVTAGQAADLPVKAQPVQYVKICSLYGAGFYYMPGTDTCIKIGGWIRTEVTDYGGGSLQWGPFNAVQNNRTTSNLAVRWRGYITADAREQTAYGVARGYIAVGISENDTGLTSTETSNTFSANRAFVQWAGFTAGLSRSFYDFYNSAALLYRAGYLPNGDTGDGGWWTWAYTANLGGGFSATLSAEQRRMTQIIGQSGTVATDSLGGVLTGGATDTSGLGYGGAQAPDIVANLRVDQAWGNAQVMGALHEVNAPYYGTGTALSESLGHPSDAWGWVAGAGLHLNMPVPGDYFEGQAQYGVGTLRYMWHGAGQDVIGSTGGSEGFGEMADCVYGGSLATGNNTSCHLTTAWVIDAAYEHFWSPNWHESFVGAYMQVQYDNTANAILCSMEGGAGSGGIGSAAVAGTACNNNFSYWGAGSRLQWDVTKSFYIGVEALYMKLNSASAQASGIIPVNLGLPAASTCSSGTSCVANNQSDWAFTIRMHKDFLP